MEKTQNNQWLANVNKPMNMTTLKFPFPSTEKASNCPSKRMELKHKEKQVSGSQQNFYSISTGGINL